jgi:hypothetical protein
LLTIPEVFGQESCEKFVPGEVPLYSAPASERAGFMRDRLWVHIQVMTHSICTSTEEPKIEAEGWIPAHAGTGEPTVWFYSRGC